MPAPKTCEKCCPANRCILCHVFPHLVFILVLVLSGDVLGQEVEAAVQLIHQLWLEGLAKVFVFFLGNGVKYLCVNLKKLSSHKSCQTVALTSAVASSSSVSSGKMTRALQHLRPSMSDEKS